MCVVVNTSCVSYVKTERTHVQDEDTEMWEKNYFSGKTGTKKHLPYSALCFLNIHVAKHQQAGKQPSGGTAHEITVKQTGWAPHSMQDDPPPGPPLCPHQPVC